MPLAMAAAILLDDDDAYTDHTDQFAASLEAAGFIDIDIEIALVIEYHRNTRSRRRYRQRVRSLARLLTLGFLFSAIALVHSYDSSFLSSVSLKDVIEKYTYHGSGLSRSLCDYKSEGEEDLRSKRGTLGQQEPVQLPPDLHVERTIQGQHSEHVSQLAGYDSPRRKIHECHVEPKIENRIHFREVGEVTGNDGMVHLGMFFDLAKMMENMGTLCKLPKKIRDHVKKDFYRDNSIHYSKKQSKDKGNFGNGGAPQLELIYTGMAKRCQMMVEQSVGFYHMFLSSYNHGQTVSNPGLQDSMNKAHMDLKFYSHKHLVFPDEYESLHESYKDRLSRVPNCTGNNPYGDPWNIATWDDIFANRRNYNESMYPLSPDPRGGCRFNTTAFNEFFLAVNGRHRVESAVEYPYSLDDFESRKKKRNKRKSARNSSDPLGAAAERVKRFILALFMSVVAIGSLLFSKFEMDEMAIRANQNTDQTVKLFNSQDHSLKIHEAAISTLNKTVDALTEVVKGTQEHLQALQITLNMYVSLDTYFEEHTRLIRGLTSLIQHKLSPDLIRSDELTRTITELKSKMEKIGYHLGIQNLDDIFRLDTSWSVYANGTIFCATHVPVFRKSTRFALLEPDTTAYIAPSASNPNIAFRVEGENELLAVSRDGIYFQTLSWQDISRCSRSGALYMCPDANIVRMHTSEMTSCLIAMYKGSIDQIKKLCKWRSVIKSGYALQLSGNKYLIRVSKPTTIRFVCGAGESMEVSKNVAVSDTATVQVAAACQAYFEDYVLEGRLEFAVRTNSYVSSSINPDALFSDMVNASGQVDWTAVEEARKTYDPDGIPFTDVGGNFKRITETAAQNYIRDIIILVVVIVLGIVTLVVTFRCILPYIRRRGRMVNAYREPPIEPRPPRRVFQGLLRYLRGSEILQTEADFQADLQRKRAANLRREQERLLELQEQNQEDFRTPHPLPEHRRRPPPGPYPSTMSLAAQPNDYDMSDLGVTTASVHTRRPSEAAPLAAHRHSLYEPTVPDPSVRSKRTLSFSGVNRTQYINSESLKGLGQSTGSLGRPPADNPFYSVSHFPREDVEDAIANLSTNGNSLTQQEAMLAALEQRRLEPAKEKLISALLRSLRANGAADGTIDCNMFLYSPGYERNA